MEQLREQYHFIGIGGIGMSALANILLQKGIHVSGSDIAPSHVTQQLQSMGAEISIGHSSSNIKDPSVIIYSTAVKDENPEVKEAKLCGVPFLHRSDLLHQLMEGYLPLLVAGTHGKTTTSSLLTHLLVSAGLDPAYAVGGMISSLNANGGHGNGKYFVAEADESDGSFLKYSPFGAIITNIDNDHLDYWKTFDALIEGFKKFIRLVPSPEHLLWCGDDEILRSLHPKGYSYGFDEKNDLYIQNFCQDGWKNIFDIRFKGKEYAEIEIPLVGAHNVLNAAAVFGLGIKIQIPEDKIRKAFSSFKGISRRSEFKGEKKGISIFDDYGHHPTEIFATLRGIKHATPHRRLIAAFQPHRYSRTRDCLHEFGPAFLHADQLILTDIYAAGETPIYGITSQTLLEAIKESSTLDVLYVPRSKLSQFLADHLQPEDVLVTMGAGDITKVGPEVLQLLEP
jgi:UDP-N-acetylmuramate--alanine ligase